MSSGARAGAEAQVAASNKAPEANNNNNNVEVDEAAHEARKQTKQQPGQGAGQENRNSSAPRGKFKTGGNDQKRRPGQQQQQVERQRDNKNSGGESDQDSRHDKRAGSPAASGETAAAATDERHLSSSSSKVKSSESATSGGDGEMSARSERAADAGGADTADCLPQRSIGAAAGPKPEHVPAANCGGDAPDDKPPRSQVEQTRQLLASGPAAAAGAAVDRRENSAAVGGEPTTTTTKNSGDRDSSAVGEDSTSTSQQKQQASGECQNENFVVESKNNNRQTSEGPRGEAGENRPSESSIRQSQGEPNNNIEAQAARINSDQQQQQNPIANHLSLDIGQAQQQQQQLGGFDTTAPSNNNNNNNSSGANNSPPSLSGGNAATHTNHFAATGPSYFKHVHPLTGASLPTTTTTTQEITSTKRLSYLQALLLRKWPCLALTICIMSSLVFGILLSALTVYLMHGFTNCNAELAHLAHLASSSSHLAEVAAASGAGFGPSAGGTMGGHHNQHQHHHHHSSSSVNLIPHEPNTDVAGSAGEPIDPTARRLLAASPGSADQPDDKLTNKTGVGANQQPATTTTQFQRLPTALVPQHYNLFIWPHIAEPSFHFNGSVEIHLTCVSPTSNITLHTLDLDVSEKSIKLSKLPAPAVLSATRARRQAPSGRTNNRLARAAPAATNELKVTKLSQDKQLQYSIVHLEAPLEAGQDYLLRLDFAGTLNDDLAGFYKIKYERQNSSEPTWIAATQFQATDARRAFPCFDEPLYKATFSIKIRHWRNMTALSNMPIVSSEQSQDGLWITDTFAKSQRMSTYLVAFAVTNFESRTAGNITVWTRPGLVHTADYALRIADRILRHYEDFFGIAYPLPKMDMIALPDFNAGAMENWGLITYRETAMLYDEATSSVANKQRVAVVVAHELAHQWFGNLVTPKWWDDLWLNEGFASFVEYIGVDHVEPKWKMLDQFVVEEVQNVFKVDALASSHQISIPVNNPDEISEIFDHISYAKGASIIRMMSHFLGDRVFKLGLQRYLRALKYNNAEQSDLWSHLTDAQQLVKGNDSSLATSASSVDVGRVMNSWTLQTGYPLVTLTRRYDAQNSAQLDQVRFQPDKIVQELVQTNNSSTAGKALANNQTGLASTTAANQQRWEIPITFTWKSDQNWEPNTRLWMHQNQTSPIEIRDPRMLPRSPQDWMLVNVKQVGYYRVNYDLQNWRLLINQLQEDHTKIETTNRAQLLDDIFEMAKSKLIDYGLAMESTKYLRNERDYMPWEAVLLSFGYIDEMLQRTPIYGDWQDYFSQLIEPYYSRYKDLDWTKPQANNTSGLAARGAGPSSSPSIDPNDILEQYNMVNAVSWACQVNNQHCISKAKQVFQNWRKTGVNNIQPALRFSAYCTAIEFGNTSDWDFLWRVYEREQGATERDRILRALACSREMWILSRYLDWTFNKSKPIRRQDGAYVFRMIARNNYGRDLAFNFMRERWPTIREFYGKTSFSLGNLIKAVSNSMNTQVELDQLKIFYESIKNDVGTGNRSFQISINEVEGNVWWRTTYYKIFENWLQKERQPFSTGAAAA